MIEPAFSVIVPAHNYARFLPTTLDSVFSQGRDDVEVIVVDDASTDETPDVLARYQGRIRLLTNDSSLGPAGAWARGLEVATGRYVCKLDADDWQLPGCLDAWERAFVAYPRSGAVIGGVHVLVEHRDGTYQEHVAGESTYLEPEVFRRDLIASFFFRMPGLCVRREALRGHEPPRTDLRLPHDWEYLIRVMRGWGAVLLPQAVAVYRIHGASLTTTSHLQERMRRDVVRLVDIWSDAEEPGHLSGEEYREAVAAAARTYLDVVSPTIAVMDLREHLVQVRWVTRTVLARADLGSLVVWRRLRLLLWRRVRERVGGLILRRSPGDVRELLPP